MCNIFSVAAMNCNARKHKMVHSEARSIIANVVKFFDEQKASGKWLFPLQQATELAAAATGKSVALIKTIRKEYTTAGVYE